MSQLKENDERTSQLNNLQYEHTISISNAIISKAELLFTISVLMFSVLYLTWYRNDTVLENYKKIIAFVFYFTIFVYFLRRIFWGVRAESIFIVKTLGLQKTTVYHSNFKSSVFIPWHSINDVIINEAIVMQKVIFYLAVLVKADKQGKGESIVPLFANAQPRLAELKEIYKKIQLILKY